MKTMTENFGGNEYPPMKLPKQENATSSFEEKCNGLVEIISRSFDFFMWYAGLPKCRRYELCSTVFLECIFLQILPIFTKPTTCADVCYWTKGLKCF